MTEAVWVGSGHRREQCGPTLSPECLCSCDLARGAWGGQLGSAPPSTPSLGRKPQELHWASSGWLYLLKLQPMPHH